MNTDDVIALLTIAVSPDDLIALLIIAMAVALIWWVVRIFETNDAPPVALLTGLVGLVFVLLVLATMALVEGPVTKLVQ